MLAAHLRRFVIEETQSLWKVSDSCKLGKLASFERWAKMSFNGTRKVSRCVILLMSMNGMMEKCHNLFDPIYDSYRDRKTYVITIRNGNN